MQCSRLSWKSCQSWSEFWEIQTLICKEMCEKLMVLTKSCRSWTDGPALVSNTVEMSSWCELTHCVLIFLTHWAQNKMVAILHMTYIVSWMISFVLQFKLNCYLFLGTQFTVIQHCFEGNGLPLNRHEVITWTNVDPDRWHQYMVSQGHIQMMIILHDEDLGNRFDTNQ